MDSQTLFFFLLLQPLLGVSSNEKDLIQLFTEALRCIEAIQRERDDVALERLYRQLDDHTRTVSAILSVLSFVEETHGGSITAVESVYRCLRNVLNYDTREVSSAVTPAPPLIRSNRPGRPRYDISSAQIQHCLALGMNWQRISRCLCIGRRTLYNHRERLRV